MRGVTVDSVAEEVEAFIYIYDMYYETVTLIAKCRIEKQRRKERESLDTEKCRMSHLLCYLPQF